jgi:peptidoglycan/LPS O-acetylase OafA/YrhL
VDLASCTTSAVRCDDTGTTTSVWPLVAQVVLVVLLALAVWWLVRHRLRPPARRPQRRAHVSAAGELVQLEDL